MIVVVRFALAAALGMTRAPARGAEHRAKGARTARNQPFQDEHEAFTLPPASHVNKRGIASIPGKKKPGRSRG